MTNKELIAEWQRLVAFDAINCASILDIGCSKVDDYGLDWWETTLFKNAPIRIGVEAFEPWLREREARYSGTFIHGNIIDLIRDKSLNEVYDVIMASEVIEHLSKDDGLILIDWMLEHGRTILINTPIGMLECSDTDNPFQTHLSGWEEAEFIKRGFQTSIACGKLMAWKLG